MTLLGIDSFSLRWQGWDAFQFLDHAAELGLDARLGGNIGHFVSPRVVQRVGSAAASSSMRWFGSIPTTFALGSASPIAGNSCCLAPRWPFCLG